MKKLLTILFLFLIMPAFAINVGVESLNSVDKDVQNAQFSARVIENASFKDGFGFYEDDIIEGIVIKSVEAKRGKRSGYYIITLEETYRDGFKRSYDYSNLEAKVVAYSKTDWKKTGVKTGLNAGLTVGSFYLPGLSQAFYFTKGMIKPYENKTRFKSGLQSVWENSPFILIKKGEELNIEEGDYLILKFYRKDVPKWRYFKRTK